MAWPRSITTRAWIAALVGPLVGLLIGCAAPATHGPAVGASAAEPAAASAADDDALIIVAVDDAPEALPGAGSTPRASYGHTAGYAGSTRALAAAAEVASEHRLQQQAAWSIASLQLRCMLYRIAPGSTRAAVLAALARDSRVQLAQPLNRFETLAAPPDDRPNAPSPPSPPGAGSAYNDPYIGLQRGFSLIDAAEAQRWSRGDGVRVALIDTGVDTAHPDLEGRIADQRDHAGAAHPAAAGGERHGTEMAGVIAAGANNGVGIVGVAPMARLLVYRACWPVAGGGSRCDSFTLAQALGAAIAAHPDIINLSLGGPADPLLQRLAEHAMQHGAIIVGAVPPDGRLDGFPVGVPGVLAVVSSDDAGPATAAHRVLAAPGRDILTLAPGGHYDYASGSSLAAAHVSGALALLRALDPGLRADTARNWLEQAPRQPDVTGNTGAAAAPDSAPAAVNACAAVHRLQAAAVCRLPDKRLP